MKHEKGMHLPTRLRESIVALLQRGLHDPRLEGVMLTVTEVKLTVDSREAMVHVSVLPEKAQKKAMAALAHACTHIRREVADKLDLHNPPLLRFVLDLSGKKQLGILAALSKVAQEREQVAKPSFGGNASGITPERTPDV